MTTETTSVALPHPKQPNSYAELKRRIQAAHLMDRQPGYYVRVILTNLLLLAVCCTIYVLVQHSVLITLNTLFLAIIFGQVAYVMHDAGHRQIFYNSRLNNVIAILHGNLILGVSADWWTSKHNAHHAQPNHLDADPEIDVPILAYTTEQALASRGIPRMIMRYQAWFFFPLLMLATPMWHITSMQYLWKEKPAARHWEWLALAVHWVLHLGLPFLAFEPLMAVWVIFLHQGLTGLYLASCFAPNHKGMLLLDADHDLDFLQAQVLTARNVRRNPVIDWWYGGLNYQIEHHLLPRLPRNHLPAAQRIVKAYCAEIGVPYYETSMVESYGEILSYLHLVSAPLREGKPILNDR